MALHRCNPLDLELTTAERPDSDAPVAARRVWEDESGNQYHGVWQAEPGTHANLPGPETVVVLQGRATVSNQHGEKIDVGAGDLVVVEAGDTATWTVHEHLRKVFVINKG